MERRSVDAIVGALNAAAVRYLVVGGLAVVAHGYVRFTADVDLIVDLETANLTRAIAALETLGYRPRAPVAFAEFADPRKRAEWVRDKSLMVFSVYSPQHTLTEIGLFVEPPLDFDAAFRRAIRKEVAPGVAATFIGIRDLVHLKQRAGRPQDLLDLEKLASLDAEALASGPVRTAWEEGWDGHEAQQRERLSRLPLIEKLRWLEEAHHLVLHLSSATPASAAPANDKEPRA